MLPVITTRRHDAIVADLERRLAEARATNAKLFRANCKLAKRLAPFIASRPRDAQGRFLPGGAA